MADYIERQAIYKKIAEMEETAMDRYLDTPWDSPARERYRAQLNERTALKHIIADEPSANVREDVQGKWETNSDRPDTLICSVCGAGYDVWKHDPHNFCPNCGARMVGGGER